MRVALSVACALFSPCVVGRRVALQVLHPAPHLSGRRISLALRRRRCAARVSCQYKCVSRHLLLLLSVFASPRLCAVRPRVVFAPRVVGVAHNNLHFSPPRSPPPRRLPFSSEGAVCWPRPRVCCYSLSAPPLFPLHPFSALACSLVSSGVLASPRVFLCVPLVPHYCTIASSLSPSICPLHLHPSLLLV